MTTRNMTVVGEPGPASQHVEEVFLELPQATEDSPGCVRRAAAVPALAEDATLAQAVAAFNDLLEKGKAAGFLS